MFVNKKIVIVTMALDKVVEVVALKYDYIDGDGDVMMLRKSRRLH